MGYDISRENKGIRNATMVFKVTDATMIQDHCCNNVIEGHFCNNVIQDQCCNNVMKVMTDRHGQAHKTFFTYATA
jgi:hypothetical protein